MKYNSNPVVRFLEYDFQVTVSKALLKTKFPCKFYTALRYHPDLPELTSPEINAENGNLAFNCTHRFSLNMTYSNGSFLPYQVSLSVGVRSKYRPIQKIIAGFVTLDLSHYMKHNLPPNVFRIERCPDQESVIEIAIRANKIRQVTTSEGNAKAHNKAPSNTCQLLKKPEPYAARRSVILNRSTVKQELHETASGNEFSKVSYSHNRLPERTFASQALDMEGQSQSRSLKEPINRRSLRFQEVRTSFQVLPTELANLEAENRDLKTKNQELFRIAQKAEDQKAKKQVYIESLQQEITELRTKLDLEERKSLLTSQNTSNHIFTDRQTSSQNLGSVIGSERDCKFLGQLDIFQRNSQLIKSLDNLQDKLFQPILSLQQLLWEQRDNPSQNKVQECLEILGQMTQTLSLSDI